MRYFARKTKAWPVSTTTIVLDDMFSLLLFYVRMYVDFFFLFLHNHMVVCTPFCLSTTEPSMQS